MRYRVILSNGVILCNVPDMVQAVCICKAYPESIVKDSSGRVIYRNTEHTEY